MANKPLQTIKFPGLTDTYTVPQVDSNFVGTAGQVPDSKKVHDEIDSLKEDLNIVQSDQEDHISAVETMLSALCGILDNGVYITDQSDAIDALRNSLNPTGISIRYVSGKAVISRLNNINISWTGTVASVGGSV